MKTKFWPILLFLWVDLLKGFAIICVILGHRGYVGTGFLPKYMKPEIVSFVIPLFFFLSGIVFSIDKYSNFKSFFIKKVKTILVPMVLFSLIIIFFNYLYRGLLLGKKDYSMLYLKNRLIDIVFHIRGRSEEPSALQTLLWFLVCLFVVQMIMYFIIKITKNKTLLILLSCCILFAIGAVYMSLKFPLIPWYFENALVLILFFGLGYIIKNEQVFFNRINKLYLAPLFLIINLSTMYFNYLYMGKKAIGLAASQIGMPLLYLLESLSGILFCVIIFSRIKKCRPLSYIGKNSLIYYGMESVMAFIPDIIFFNVLHINVAKMGNFSIIIYIMYVVIVCLATVPIVELINRKMPFIKGQF